MTASKQNKRRIFYEPDKLGRTSHWDLDHLPLKEVEAHFARLAKQHAAEPDANRRRSARFRLARFKLGLILITAGIALMASAVLVGRYISAD